MLANEILEEVTEYHTEEFLGFLETKIDLLTQILEMTKAAEIYETVESAPHYSLLMEQRDLLFSDIKEIDQNLLMPCYKKLEKSKDIEFLNKWEALQQDIKKIVTDILRIDKEHARISNEIMIEIKHNMKEIVNTKNMNNRYNDDMQYYEGSLFDKKK